MATYAPRPDGLFDVTLDSGQTLPMPLREDQLLGAGATAAPPRPDLGATSSIDLQALSADQMEPPQLQAPAPMASDAPPAAGLISGFQAEDRANAAPMVVPKGFESGFGQTHPQAPAVRPPQISAPPGTAPKGRLVRPDAPEAGPGSTQAQGPGASSNAFLPPDAQQALVRAAFDEMRPRGGGAPARMMPTSMTVKPGKALPPGTKEALDAAGAREDETLRRGAEAQIYGQETQAQALEQQIQQTQRGIDDEKVRRARLDGDLEQARQQIEARRADAENVQNVDPNRVWKQNSGAMLLGAIGMAIAEYGRVLSGGSRNVAKELIDAVIDRDIQQQRDDYDRAKDKVGAARNTYGELLELYGDPNKAQAELRLREEALADHRLKLAAQRSGSDLVMANLDAQLAANAERRAMQWAQLVQSTQADVTEQWSLRGGGGAGGGKLSSLISNLKGIKELGASEKDPARLRVDESRYGRTVNINGKPLYTNDQGRAKEYQGVVDVFPQITSNIGKLEKIIRENAQSADPAARAEVESLQGRITLNMKQLETLGAITKADQELVSPLIASSAKDLLSLDSSSLKTLYGAKAHARQRYNAVEKNLYHDPELTQPLLGPAPKTEE